MAILPQSAAGSDAEVETRTSSKRAPWAGLLPLLNCPPLCLHRGVLYGDSRCPLIGSPAAAAQVSGQWAAKGGRNLGHVLMLSDVLCFKGRRRQNCTAVNLPKDSLTLVKLNFMMFIFFFKNIILFWSLGLKMHIKIKPNVHFTPHLFFNCISTRKHTNGNFHLQPGSSSLAAWQPGSRVR